MPKNRNTERLIQNTFDRKKSFDFGALNLEFASKARKGFTFVELIIVFTLLGFLFAMGATVMGNFNTSQGLRFGGDRLVQTFREAHANSVSQVRDSAWGVYLNTGADPKEYTLFKGNSYATRDSSFDQLNFLFRKVNFQNVSLNGGGQEVVFSKRSGFTDDHGTLQLVAHEEAYSISINALGMIDFNF